MARRATPSRVAGRVIDIDSARAARAEATQESPVLRFGGRDYELPVELPALAVLALDSGDAQGTIRGLLGDKAEDFLAGAAWADVETFVEAVPGIYGLGTGE